MRQSGSYHVFDVETFRLRIFSWLQHFDPVAFLDSNNYNKDRFSSYDLIVGAGAASELQSNSPNSFENLKLYHQQRNDWLFGYFTYDLKNQVEDLISENFDGLRFPEIHFFQPVHVLSLKKDQFTIETLAPSADAIFAEILATETYHPNSLPQISFHPRMSRSDYIGKVEKISDHIVEGDVYEMNLCQEFYCKKAVIDPASVFHTLNALAAAPFSAYYRSGHHYLICTSPERFLKKQGQKLISQPIKGTAPRGKSPEEDEKNIKWLAQSEKDRAENIMIVDLVRNDLSRSAVAGSVKVDELFGIYTFPGVHQMISTVTAELRTDVHFVDAIKRAFPMGSMTGAPKIMAMELIEKYELSKRGIYSGSVGYITPTGDFDFNVIIRSIAWNAESRYLSYHTGGAITIDSDPALEYEECMVKAGNILRVFGGKDH